MPSSSPGKDIASDSEVRCSFCGRPQSTVGPMVEGPHAFICVDCVRLAVSVADANAGKSRPTDLDPNEWHSAHMHLVCYARVQRNGDTWTAESSPPPGLTAQGATAAEAIRRLQAKLLHSTAEAVSEGKDVGRHFTNHADALQNAIQQESGTGVVVNYARAARRSWTGWINPACFLLAPFIIIIAYVMFSRWPSRVFTTRSDYMFEGIGCVSGSFFAAKLPLPTWAQLLLASIYAALIYLLMDYVIFIAVGIIHDDWV